MTSTNSLSRPTRILIGSIIGLFVALFFVFSAHTQPSWGSLWMIRPIIVLSFAGAMGGFCNYLIMHYRGILGVHKILAISASILVFIFGIWMGIVLGFNGTLWN